MFRIHVLLLALTLAVSGCGKKKEKKVESAVSPAAGQEVAMQEMGTEGPKAGMQEGGAQQEGAKPAEAGKTCELPEHGLVKKDLTFPKGCKMVVGVNIEIDEGATLAIEPGVRLEFKVDHGIIVRNGKLVARGTASEPIVLTSANPTPAPGDWNGIMFEETHMTGQILEHVTLEFAGHSNHTSETGGVIVVGSQGDGRISLVNCILRNNARGGIVNRIENAAFVKVDGCTFEKNGGNAMVVHVQNLANVSANNKMDEKITIFGRVKKTMALPKLPVPYYVEENIEIGNDENPPTLTIPEDAVLRFKGETGLFVADGGAGSLAAKKVTFTSHSDSPRAGDWYGLTLREKTSSTSLEECTIEFAGKDGPIGKGAIVVESEDVLPKRASLSKITIKNSEKAFSGPKSACDEMARAERGNLIDGKPFACPKEEE